MEELYIMHNEMILDLTSKKNIASFTVKYAVPIIDKNQHPLYVDIKEDNSNKISDFSIKDDKFPPNKILEFTIKHCKKNEKIRIHFEFIVLIHNESYDTIPSEIPFDYEQLSNKYKTWLKSTDSVQSNNFLIRYFSKLMKGFNTNLINVVNNIIIYTPIHLYFLQLIRLILETNPLLRRIFLPKKYFTGLMDAISYLFFGGLCAAQTNFSTALLRAQGIPTRILIVTMFGRVFFTGEKTWLDSHHYMMEIYLPEYGWVKATPGKFPHETKNYVILRKLYPQDENVAGNGLSYYGGMAPWFWIDNENVSLLFPEIKGMMYKKPHGNVSGVPAIRLWNEGKILVDPKELIKILETIDKIWNEHISIFNTKINENNQKLISNSMIKYEKAILSLQKGEIKRTISNLNDVLKEFKKLLRKNY